MTLSEIEILLEDLITRHPNLDTELLTTLLLASGFDSKTIKEVVFLFKQKNEKKGIVQKSKEFEIIGLSEKPTEKEIESLALGVADTINKQNLHLLKNSKQQLSSSHGQQITSTKNSSSFLESILSLFFGSSVTTPPERTEVKENLSHIPVLPRQELEAFKKDRIIESVLETKKINVSDVVPGTAPVLESHVVLNIPQVSDSAPLSTLPKKEEQKMVPVISQPLPAQVVATVPQVLVKDVSKNQESSFLSKLFATLFGTSAPSPRENIPDTFSRPMPVESKEEVSVSHEISQQEKMVTQQVSPPSIFVAPQAPLTPIIQTSAQVPVTSSYVVSKTPEILVVPTVADTQVQNPKPSPLPYVSDTEFIFDYQDAHKERETFTSAPSYHSKQEERQETVPSFFSVLLDVIFGKHEDHISPSEKKTIFDREQHTSSQVLHRDGELKSTSRTSFEKENSNNLEHRMSDLGVNKETGSLIIHKEKKKIEQQKDVDLPENLPLLPFESSPHVWSFSHYKDKFHSDISHGEQNGEENKEDLLEQLSKKTVEKEEEYDEISLEKTPLTRGDESLVFLAGSMLLVIILILGYMYSNGRL